jgi:hypothetical protein
MRTREYTDSMGSDDEEEEDEDDDDSEQDSSSVDDDDDVVGDDQEYYNIEEGTNRTGPSSKNHQSWQRPTYSAPHSDINIPNPRPLLSTDCKCLSISISISKFTAAWWRHNNQLRTPQ